MLDVIGMVVLAAVIAVNINAVSNAMPLSAAARLAIASIAGAWTGLAAAVAAAGVFANTSLPFPWIGIFVALPMVAVGAAVATSPVVRAALLAIPPRVLVGINSTRVLGIFFVLLAASGRLGGPFPQSAGWGDVITGVLAVPLALIAGREGVNIDRALWGWNVLGTLDLFAAMALGVTSANGSPLQLIYAGAGSEAAQLLPWTLIPTVLVPFYLITHGILFAQLRVRRRTVSATRASTQIA